MNSEKMIKQKEEEYLTIIEELNIQMARIKQQKADLDDIIEKITDKKSGE